MKTIRLLFVFMLGFMAFLCLFSYVTRLEAGEGGGWLFFAAIAFAVSCWRIGRYWGAKDKLPEEVENEKNDIA